MAKPDVIARLIEKLTPKAQKAFMDGIASLRSDVQIELLKKAISRGDVNAALRLVGLGNEYFAPLDRAVREAYAAGGDAALAALASTARGQGVTIRARFDDRVPRVEEFLANSSSRRIVEISKESRDLVRKVLEKGIANGQGANSLALDIVGRINRATGKREGGILGLTSRDKAARDRAFAELRSGDPKTMVKYLRRKTRDRRLDGAVRSAIKSGKPVPANKARKMATRMEQIMLRNRGETIARTELTEALNRSASDAVDQLIERGDIAPNQVTETWDSSEDEDTRDSHAEMNNQVRVHGQPFRTPSGYLMRYPGDRNLGAPASEVINCRCRVNRRIDFVSGLGRNG